MTDDKPKVYSTDKNPYNFKPRVVKCPSCQTLAVTVLAAPRCAVCHHHMITQIAAMLKGVGK